MLLEVRTGCRLHFGLMELADGRPLRFGGLGLMLDQPGWHLRFSERTLDPPWNRRQANNSCRAGCYPGTH